MIQTEHQIKDQTGNVAKPLLSADLIPSDLSNLEIGKFYNVRCAEVQRHFNKKSVLVPIIGDSHIDAQFNITFEHFHIDGRFTARNSFYNVDSLGRTNKIIQVDKSDRWFDCVSKIVIAKKKCLRLTTGINPPRDSFKYNLWYDSMVGKKCEGKKCPHLGTEMLEVDGKLVCPLHNLKVSLTTKLVVCR